MEDTPEDIAAAEAQGWQSDFEGDNKKSAKEFVHDGRFFKKIDELKAENVELKSSVQELKGHYERVTAHELKKAEADYKKTIEPLKADKVTALDEGDNHRVVEIDDQIRNTEKPSEPIAAPVNPGFDGWAKENEWYGKDTFLRIEADKIGEAYFASGLRDRALYDAVGEHVKEVFPDKFANSKRAKAPTVEGGTNNGDAKPSGSKVGEKDLTADERTVFNNFKKIGAFPKKEDEQQYFRDVLEIRG